MFLKAHAGSHSYSVSTYLNQEVYRNNSEAAAHSEIYTPGAGCSLYREWKEGGERYQCHRQWMEFCCIGNGS